VLILINGILDRLDIMFGMTGCDNFYALGRRASDDQEENQNRT
jgi:hypothetical protein